MDIKKVIVTGGTRGIGRAVSELFAANGYTVIAVYRSDESAAKSLQSDNIIPFCCDITDKSELKKLIEAHSDACVLVNNAGVALRLPFDAVSDEQAREIYMTDLYGTVEASRLLLPHLLHRKDGVIINVSSIWGRDGASCEVDYSTAKAAVIGFTKALAKEVGPSGIRVNCVCPGIVDTDMNGDLSYSDIVDFTDGIPLERMAEASEIARSIYFLASAEASYITGAVLDVNGGL